MTFDDVMDSFSARALETQPKSNPAKGAGPLGGGRVLFSFFFLFLFFDFLFLNFHSPADDGGPGRSGVK